ncbi:MAG: hypothetical protein M1825_004804 [Sarcosagium campestre]|nr:MAG: hypothetical protein M1825_004804 [Sarcosagium campestre]
MSVALATLATRASGSKAKGGGGGVLMGGSGPDREKLDRATSDIAAAAALTISTEPVVIKGAGRAVERVAALGVWFQERGDEYRVEVRLKAVSAVDDVVLSDAGDGELGSAPDGGADAGGGPDTEAGTTRGQGKGREGTEEEEGVEEEEEEEEEAFETMRLAVPDAEEVPLTRVRRIPVLEVLVRMK